MPNRRSACPSSPPRRQTIDKLKAQIEAVAGEPVTFHAAPDCPPEIQEQFLRNILAFEQAEDVVLFEHLEAQGICLPAPEELSDEQLGKKVPELVVALAGLGVYLHCTDHLSDRELYAHLWKESLREGAAIFPDNPDYAYHIDLIGSGSEEDVYLYLKYYADEAERQSWASDWPDMQIPEPTPRPFDRDRTLPHPRNDPWQPQ